MSSDNVGNFVDSSTPLDLSHKWQPIQDNLSLDNTDDYYSFSLSNRSTFSILLNRLSDNADIRLLDENGSEIASSSQKENIDENIEQTLDAGNYYVHVEQAGDAVTSYNMKFRSKSFDFNLETIEGGVSLTDTKIFYADDVSDVKKVDVWLKTDDGKREKVGSVSEFSINDDASIGFSYDINNLKAGDYIISGKATDNFGTKSNTWSKSFTVENVAPSVDLTIEQVNGGIELDGTAFDANGVDEIERIDIEYKKEGGEWIEIDDTLNLTTNEDGSIAFEYSISGLQQGNYEVKATAYDTFGAVSQDFISDFQIDNLAPSNFEFEVEEIEGGVRVIDSRVDDENGIDDLAKVDFWLVTPDGSWQDIEDVTEFHTNEDGSFSFDYSINSLASGDYTLWAISYDRLDMPSNSLTKNFQVIDNLNSDINDTSTDVEVVDNFNLNINDTSLDTLTRSLFSDGSLSRNDMIAILDDAGDNGVVDATEFNDLHTIIDNASYLKMEDYVRVLANKVVNGDVANKSGNLQAESSDTLLEELINKWFYGGDRPDIPDKKDTSQTDKIPDEKYTYRYTEGSLFQDGISHDDIRQGYINTCFFLAGLGATLVKSPQTIKSMFIDNGDNTFTVRFYNNGVADYVTVDRYLPTDAQGNLVYANVGDKHNDPNNELWVALAEKAYAQIHESGWIDEDNKTNSYSSIDNNGLIGNAFAHITGKSATVGRVLDEEQRDLDRVVNAFESGEVVGFGSKSGGVAQNIVTSHAYALIDYNPVTDKFTLLNPWNTDNNAHKSRTLELTRSEIISNFSSWDSTITISNVVST